MGVCSFGGQKMTDIVLYHPKLNQLTTAFYAWELVKRCQLGWEIICEL